MSEKLTPQTEEPSDMRQPLPHELGSQTGAVDVHAITERVGELTERAANTGRLALHGLGGAIAQKRMERAGKRMERMEHKEALYKNIGAVAMGGEATETHHDQIPRPRTFAERFMDKRAEKKAFKRAYQEAAHIRTRKNFGGKKRVDTMGVGTKIAAQQRRQDVKRRYKQGEITAAERRANLTEIKGTPTPFESSAQRKARRAEERSVKKLEKTARQKHLTNWRTRRRKNAVESIKNNHHRAEYHRARATSIRTGNEVTYDMPDERNRGQGGFVELKPPARSRTVGSSEQALPYPPRPSRQKAHKARTTRGKRYQEQQARNRAGVI